MGDEKAISAKLKELRKFLDSIESKLIPITGRILKDELDDGCESLVDGKISEIDVTITELFRTVTNIDILTGEIAERL